MKHILRLDLDLLNSGMDETYIDSARMALHNALNTKNRKGILTLKTAATEIRGTLHHLLNYMNFEENPVLIESLAPTTDRMLGDIAQSIRKQWLPRPGVAPSLTPA